MPGQLAVLIGDDGDAAAADRDHDEAVLDQGADRVDLDDPDRLGRGDDPAPASPGILLHRPAVLVAPSHRLGLVHERADRLRRALEGRIVGRHLHLGHDRHGVAVDVEPVEVVLEVLRQGVADRALAVGAADVERHLVQLV